MEWTRVKWSEARQILSILDVPTEAPAADPAGSPKAYFDALRAAGQLPDAVSFLAQALPRLEAVTWAARSVRDVGDARQRKPAEAAALKAALLWVQDPSESRRRAAFDAAAAADASSAEALAALAAFFSGGSIAPGEYEPIPAPRDAAGRFAAGAVLIAAVNSGDMNAALNRCLDAGEALAAEGLAAGAAA